MSHIDRQAKKAIMFGLHYGMSGKSHFMQILIEEQVKMMASMAMAKSTGIGYICLEQPDYSSLELRLLNQVHDEMQWQVAPGIEPERHYTKNQRGRHWERTRQDKQVKVVTKTAQQLLDEDFANDNPSSLVYKLGSIAEAPHRKSIACQVVSAGGKLTLQYRGYRWWMDSILGTDFVN